MLYFEREKQVGIFANLSRNFCWFKWEFLLDFLGGFCGLHVSD